MGWYENSTFDNIIKLSDRDKYILTKIEKLLSDVNDTGMVQSMTLKHAMTCIESYFTANHIKQGDIFHE